MGILINEILLFTHWVYNRPTWSEVRNFFRFPETLDRHPDTRVPLEPETETVLYRQQKLYVYVCTYVCVYVHVCTICICVRTRVYPCSRVCVQVHTYRISILRDTRLRNPRSPGDPPTDVTSYCRSRGPEDESTNLSSGNQRRRYRRTIRNPDTGVDVGGRDRYHGERGEREVRWVRQRNGTKSVQRGDG